MSRETLTFSVGVGLCIVLCVGSALWVWTLALNFDDWVASTFRRYALLTLATLLPVSLGVAGIAAPLIRRAGAVEAAAVIVWLPILLFFIYALVGQAVFLIPLVDTIAEALGFTYMRTILI